MSFADVEVAELADWRMLFRALHARFLTGDFATGLRLVAAVGEAAEAADHHPDVDLRYPSVGFRLSSHDVGGVTSRDVDLARTISETAMDLGVAADPGAVSVVEIALDSTDHEEFKPFWRAVLGSRTPRRAERCTTVVAACRRCGSSRRRCTKSRASASAPTSGCPRGGRAQDRGGAGTGPA